jgi:AcrR family transcriptional regulator
VSASPNAGAASIRPGGRSARVRAEVLAAVREELTAHGYDGLSVEAVARRSGVHRATVYRRWKDVGGLLADTVEEARDDGWQAPDAGNLTDDLVILNREVHAAFTEEPSISAALVAASFRSPPAADALRAFWADRYARCLPVVERAVSRAEVPSGTDATRLLIAATAPVYQHLILFRAPLRVQEVDRYARDAAEAGRAGVYVRT